MRRPIPQELVDIWYEYVSAVQCRDQAVKGFFKFQVRNALIFGKTVEQKKLEFWSKIREIYPEFKGKEIQADIMAREVFEIGGN
jgi:hypothetical protein